MYLFIVYRGTFARNSLLKVLNLSHNKIRKLDSNTFRGMRFLVRLYLSDNQINDVGRGTFGPVTRIGTIDLARNFIKKIDFQMFNQLQFAEVRMPFIYVRIRQRCIFIYLLVSLSFSLSFSSC